MEHGHRAEIHNVLSPLFSSWSNTSQKAQLSDKINHYLTTNKVNNFLSFSMYSCKLGYYLATLLYIGTETRLLIPRT